MAFPVILVNSATGSDTAASGVGGGSVAVDYGGRRRMGV